MTIFTWIFVPIIHQFLLISKIDIDLRSYFFNNILFIINQFYNLSRQLQMQVKSFQIKIVLISISVVTRRKQIYISQSSWWLREKILQIMNEVPLQYVASFTCFFFFFFFWHMDDFKCQVKRNKEKVGNFQLKIVLFGNILLYSFLIKRYIIPYEKFEKVSSLETFIVWLREKLIFMLYREGKFATNKGEIITF